MRKSFFPKPSSDIFFVLQGPIGYSPTCHCMPSIQRLEQHVNDARDTVYDRIQSTNQALNDKIDQVDHRSSMRVHALEQYTKERFTEEENFCRDRINQRVEQGVFSQNGDHMKLQIQDWLEQKLEDYGHCLSHHHDDSALPNENIFTHIQETANGRLFKSRSDETLSQSDNYSGHFRKRNFYESRQAAMQQIKAWQVPQYSRDRNKVRVQQKHSQNAGARHEAAQHNQRQNWQQQHNTQQNQQNLQQTLNRQLNHQSQENMLQSHQQNHQYQHNMQQNHQQNRRQSHQQNHFPIEAKVEIRNSAKNLNMQSLTHNNPDTQNLNDPTYIKMSGFQNQGAIPKSVSQSQSWQNIHVRQSSTSRGPITHSTPKSHESSPFETSGKVVRSQTDSGISRHVQETSKARQQILSDSRQDISEQNDLKQTSSFKQSDLNLGSSQNSDKLQSSLRKPTFTTFGYDEAAKDGITAPTNSPEQNGENVNSDSVYKVHSDTLPVRSRSCSSPRYNSRTNNTSDDVDNKLNNMSSPYSRQESQASYGFVPSKKDDLPLSSSATQFSMLKQKTRSTELLTDNSLSNDSARVRLFSRSQSEDRVIDSVNQSFQNSSPRSSSESRGAVNSSVLSNSSAKSSHTPQYSSSKPSAKHSSSYIQAVNTPTDLQRSYISSAWAGSQAQMGSSSSYPYASVQEVPRGGTRNYSGPVNYPHRSDVNSNAVYSTVRDVRLQKDDNHNLTVKADVHNPNRDVYYSHDSLDGHVAYLEPRSQTAFQTYLTGPELHHSKENLFQRESSPNVCNNSKEDSSSNPDSGYSSKIYGKRAGSVNPASSNSTPSSSFSTDRGISTPSNTNSPQSTYSNTDYQQLPSQQYQDEVQTHVQSWYKRKLQEATQRCYDNWKAENSPRKLSQPGAARNYGNDDYAQIPQNVRPTYETRNYGENEYAKISQTGRNYGDDYAQISHFSGPNQYNSQNQYGGHGQLTNGYALHNNGSHLISTYSRGSDV